MRSARERAAMRAPRSLRSGAYEAQTLIELLACVAFLLTAIMFVIAGMSGAQLVVGGDDVIFLPLPMPMG